ncbi:MAG: hypothetical protein ACTS45_01695 [Candidatus Hodgkinia cicadicola]
MVRWMGPPRRMDLRCRGSYLIQCLSFASSHDAIVNDLRRCLVVLRGLESLRCWQALEAFKRPEVKRVKRLVTDDFDLNLNIRRSFAVWCFPRRRECTEVNAGKRGKQWKTSVGVFA